MENKTLAAATSVVALVVVVGLKSNWGHPKEPQRFDSESRVALNDKSMTHSPSHSIRESKTRPVRETAIAFRDHFSELRASALSLTSLSFIDFISHVRNSSRLSTAQKNELFAQAVSALSRTTDINQTLKLVIDNFGEGETRQFLLSCAFGSSCSSFSEVWSQASSLEFDEQRVAANQGIRTYIKRLESSDLDLLGNLQIKESLDATQISALIGGLSLRIQASVDGSPKESFDKAFSIILTLKSRGVVGDTEAIRFLANASVGDPVSSWEALNSLHISNGSMTELLDEEGGFIVNEMVKHSPIEIMDTLAGSDDSLGFSRNLVREWTKVATDAWLQKDQDEFSSWYSSSRSKLSPETNDLIVVQTVENLLSRGDLASAEAWVQMIESEVTREATVSRIAKH